MNYALQFLETHQERFGLRRFGWRAGMTSLVLTPRFRASSHVVFLILRPDRSEPVLVAKTPRLTGGSRHLEREATNLRQVQQLRPEGFVSIPRLIAFEEHAGRPILVQTALVASPLDPPSMRRRFDSSCQAAGDFLRDLHQASRSVGEGNPASWQARLGDTLDRLRDGVPWTDEERHDLDATEKVVAPLQTAPLPTVFEHGDFSHPNVMRLLNGRIAVVDWELADPFGLPGSDLLFFLTYAAFARQNARETGAHLLAFRDAFFGPAAWGGGHVARFAREVGVPHDQLTPLFLCAWVRYLAGLVHRLQESHGPLSGSTSDWLRQNRYYAAWRYSVNHLDQLQWQEHAA
jgi:aminoglycoside phosphotransferase (APT) family kinase protein